VQLANSEEVPLRLILGVDAERRVQQAETARATEAGKWRHLTVSTVLEDGCFDSRWCIATSGVNSWVSAAHGEIAPVRPKEGPSLRLRQKLGVREGL
jgi:hypothetical protein